MTTGLNATVPEEREREVNIVVRDLEVDLNHLEYEIEQLLASLAPVLSPADAPNVPEQIARAFGAAHAKILEEYRQRILALTAKINAANSQLEIQPYSL